MLVLCRKPGESLIIGSDIVLTILEVRGDKIRLGIEAPREVPVHRLEVAEAIAREQQLKAASSPEADDPSSAR